MFNKELKLKYLEQKSDLTKRQYKLFYCKTAVYESQHNKDLSELTLEEILDMINLINPKNEKQEKVFRAMVSGYINWSIEQGLRSNSVNPLMTR